MEVSEKVKALERQLEAYPPALNPEELAKVLSISRRYVDKLFERTDKVRSEGKDPMKEGCLVYFVLDPTSGRMHRRVSKADLINYMISNQPTN